MASRRIRFLLAAAAVIFFVGLPLITWAATVWTDYLWFVELGHEQVFVARIWSQIVVGAAFFVGSFLLLFVNMRVARKLAPRAMPIGMPEAIPVQFEMFIERMRTGFGPVLDKLILWGSLGLAWFIGLGMSQQWETFRLALSRVPFGVTDPQFGVDVSFYAFVLPALELVDSWLFDVLILTTILAAVVHLVDGAIQPWARLKGFAPHVKAHLSVLFALIVASRAFSYWIDIWNLNFSPRGQVVGASYTDVHAQLPAYRILIVISIVTALALLLNIRYRGWRLPAITLGVWIVAAIALGGVWPGLVQRFIVAPNEFAREEPYLERNIDMTRRAFGLDQVKGTSFPASEDLTADDIRENQGTLSNVRLWDPEVVQQSYTQLQSIRPYYDFADVDVDRYEVNGRRRQVLVSAREMNSSLLAEQAQTWLNTHVVYTHGNGLVMSPVSEADSRGLPHFYVGEVPPKVRSDVASGSPDLQIDQPRIYFGEDTTEYVIVNANGIDEFDYPQGETNATSRYDGSAGIEIGGFARRIAWALRLGSSQVFFSGYVTPESRVLLRRDLDSRLERLAPFLSFDTDPYPALVDGRVLWVIDGYTWTDRYPYSEYLPDSDVNYMRNSVKVTVDAYSGETTLYAFDPDPITEAWRDIFPGLIVDADQIPDGVREHLRFPQDLFEAQAEIYRTYHMTDPTVFYNKEDQWEIPGIRQGEPMQPYFVLSQLPGAAEEHFYLFQPYTPRNRDNMIGWMATSSDPGNYGERTVYLFPKERVILGPEQVSARINQDPVISPQLSLWNQRGSSVLFGNMLVIPIEDSIVYIQPIFLQAEQTAIPELTTVVVAYSDKVEMKRSLVEALLAVFGEGGGSAEESGTATPDSGGKIADAARAQQLFEDAIAAQRAGDWAEYGALIEELGNVLSELAGVEATTTAE